MVKTKRSAQDAVYDVLATLKGGVALTSKEIYNELEPADQGLFVGGVDGVMKSINKLHTRGIVVNGNSDIVNGRVVKTWQLRNGVSTNQSVVDTVAETVEAETTCCGRSASKHDGIEAEPVKIYQTEAEREYFDGFAYPKDSTTSVEALIGDQENDVESLIHAAMFLLSKLSANLKKSACYDVDPLIEGLLEVSDLLSEKIAVKNIIPVIEFLRGLK